MISTLVVHALATACPACGAAGGFGLFVLVFGVFLLMFTGTVVLFLAAAGRGEWKDASLRSEALRAENLEPQSNDHDA